MVVKRKVVWTREAKKQVDLILGYIVENWGEKEATSFLDTLYQFECIVCSFPFTYRKSKQLKGCRLGYIHKHITAIYKVSNKSITILTVIDNRSNISR